MQTFTESLGLEPTNWRHELENWNEADQEHLKNLAYTWDTCACGNLSVDIPRSDFYTPKDDRLFELGILFYQTLHFDTSTEALNTLNKIEQRAEEILSELRHKTDKDLDK